MPVAPVDSGSFVAPETFCFLSGVRRDGREAMTRFSGFFRMSEP